jgi:hypothetical protein
LSTLRIHRYKKNNSKEEKRRLYTTRSLDQQLQTHRTIPLPVDTMVLTILSISNIALPYCN